MSVADSPFHSVPGVDLKTGAGNWKHFPLHLEAVYEAAEEWKQALSGVEKPWLCWNVSPRWCVLQQRLVLEAGWTPVVGFDPRSGPPPLAPGAVLVDFNRRFQFPVMFFMFPLEFAFRFCPRLAFWHADLLCRIDVVKTLAARFDSLKDGEMTAIFDMGGRRNLLFPSRHRFWELAGCTTAGASRDQFDKGAGWWRHIDRHVNCTDPAERDWRARHVFYDFGCGIMYWKRKYGGTVKSIPEKLVKEGHCTSINVKDYKRVGPEGPMRNLGVEIDMNYSIEDVAARLCIAHLL